MKQVSILLGAGFSVYAKIADRQIINSKLKELKSDDFIINSVGIAHFTENYPNPDWLNKTKRNFIEYFISKYTSKNPNFDYEMFYDYCVKLYSNHKTSKELDSIYKEFKKEIPYYSIDKVNSMSILIRTINQLIDNILNLDKNIFESGLINKYQSFLSIIDKLVNDEYEVNIFTLNHDLLLEKLLEKSLNYTYDDGFQYFRTPYYIKQNNYQFRIRYYNQKFNSSVKVFKLHGSIDNFIVNYSEPYDMIKIPKKLNLLELYREKEIQEDFTEEHLWTLYEPHFLSGDETKVKKYNSHQYYIDMFNMLQKKLNNSELLVCIGYGLGDEELNKNIFSSYDESKKLLVVKPSKGNGEFYRNKNVIHFGTSRELKDLNITEIEELINQNS